MHFALSVFAFAASASLAVAQSSINPDSSVLEGFNGWDSTPAPVAPALTNAKRFAQKLPPLKPKAHRRHRHRAGPLIDRATHVQAAPRAGASPSPSPVVSKTCNVLLSYTNGTQAGFLAPTWNSFGEYGEVQPTSDGALQVSFSYLPESPVELELTATNGPSPSYPLFGGIVGYSSTSDTFGLESFNYAYIGGTTQTPGVFIPTKGNNSFTAASKVERNIESAIWSFNPDSATFTAQWTNSDGSQPTTHIAIVQGALIITGDIQAVAKKFGPTDEYILSCVAPLV